MKRFSAVLTVSALALASWSASAQTITLRMGHDQPVGSMYDEGHKMFKKLVEERSKGRIKADVFPAAQLGSEVAMVEGVRLGSIDVICANAPNAAAFVPELGLFSVAYLFKDIAALRARRERPAVRQAHRRDHRQQEPRHQAHRLLRRRRAQHLQPQGLGGQPRRPEGREDPRAEQPDRGQGVEDLRRDPDADELRRGLPGAAVRRARRGRERPGGHRVEQAQRGGQVHQPDRAPAQPLGRCTSTRRSSRACRPTCRRSCWTRPRKPPSTSARRTPSSSPRRPTG